MPGPAGRNGFKAPRDGARAEGGVDLPALLRQIHIFASTVREVLERQLLRELFPTSLTAPQLQLLKLMAREGQHQLGEVAHFLGVSPPAATKNVDKLEGLGLVVRERSTGDRRATLLSVSAEGRRLVEAYEEKKAERVSPILERFSAAELGQLTSLMERFSISLLGRKLPEAGFCARCCGYVEMGCPVDWMLGDCSFRKLRSSRKGQRPS